MFSYGDISSLDEKAVSKVFRGEKVLFLYGRGCIFENLKKLNEARVIKTDLSALSFLGNYADMLDFKNINQSAEDLYLFARGFNKLQLGNTDVEYRIFFFPEIIKMSGNYKNEFMMDLFTMITESIESNKKVIIVYDSVKSADEVTFKKIKEMIVNNSF